MKITLRYHPQYNDGDKIVKPEEDVVMVKVMDVREGTDISALLQQVSGAGLALYDKRQKIVIGGYEEKGAVEEGKTYSIQSSDVRRTIDFMTS